MAEQENTPKRGGNVAEMTNDPQIIHLTGRVDRLETDVHDIKSGVQKLLDRPQNPGFAQVIGTLLATLATCGLIFTFAEWRMLQAISPVSEDLVTINKKLEEAYQSTVENRVANAIMKERSDWLKSRRGWGARTEPGN